MTKDMTSGSPLRLILAFAVPLMLGSLFQQFYSMADTIIVGRFVGVEALAAVGSTGSLNYLIIGFATGLCSGFTIPVAQCFGAQDYGLMRRYVANTIWLLLAFGGVLTVLTVALTPAILRLTNTPGDILGFATDYIRTIFAGLPATLLYNLCSAVMRALGDSKWPLYFLLLASVLNIGLDIFFILSFGMGVFGAALATVISQAVAGVLSLIYLVKNFRILYFQKGELAPNKRCCVALCRMGIPMGLQCSLTAVGSVVLQTAVNGLGSAIVAAQTAGSKAGMILSVPLESIGTAMTTYAGQNYGAMKLARVREGVRRALAVACVYSVVSFVIFHYADRLVIGLFLDSGEAAIMANAQKFLFWNSVFYIPLGVLIVYRYTIQGLGYSGVAMFAGVAEMLARAVVGCLLVGRFGYIAVCIASPAAWFAACFFLIPAYRIVMRRLERAQQAWRPEGAGAGAQPADTDVRLARSIRS